ncbi:MAG TPA: branched-chain amino acid ABC transporter permease/ATP-binding protein [Acidimicrobiales bacterium]|nr:branched-chain amino acid ABC transporter permease/ATP-binding protein [Acidimicrobiales bacterium]
MTILQLALLGLGAGTAYVLLGQGIVLIYRGSGLLNFAQGAIAMLTAEVYNEMTANLGWPTPVALITAIGLAGSVGLLMQVGILRRLKQASALTRLIATLGLFTLIYGLATVWWGQEVQPVYSLLPSNLVQLGGGLSISADRLYLLLLAVTLTAVLWRVYQKTRFGLATSAVAENELVAISLGWSPNMVSAVNWTVGTALAGLAGILLAPIVGLGVSALTLAVIPGLAAALLGQFRSFWLTLAGGLGIGIAQSYVSRYVSTPGWSDAVPFLLIIALVVVRGKALPVRGEFLERPVRVGTGRYSFKWLIPLVVGAGVVIELLSSTWVLAVSTSLLLGVIALSMVLVTGYAGQISLAQVTIAGMGTLAAGLTSHYWNVPFGVCVLIGIVAAMVIGFVVGLPALRCRGVNLAVVTIGMSLVIEEVILGNQSLQGGLSGLTVTSPSLFGVSLDYGTHPIRYTLMVLVFFCLSGLVIVNIRRGSTGRRLLALRTNERAAASVGINVTAGKLFAFTVGAGIAGLAGALSAFQFAQADVTNYTTVGSISVLVNVVVGGIGYIGGGINGGLSGQSGVEYQALSYLGGSWFNYLTALGGALVLLILVVQPHGAADEIFRRLRKKKVHEATEETRTTSRREYKPVVDGGDLGRALKVHDVSVHFGRVQAVKNMTFQVAPGEVVGIIGPNGAGKTSVIDALCGFVKSSGSVSLGDVDLTGKSATRRATEGLSRTFQSVELFDDMTVLDNVKVAAERGGIGSSVADIFYPRSKALPRIAEAAIDDLDLRRDLGRNPDELPAGRRRLVGIARALSGSPGALLLDEPAAGLSDIESSELGHLIRHLADNWDLSVVLVEHNVDLVARVCDRVVAMDLGAVIAQGSPDDVLRSPAVVAAYLGQSIEGPVLPEPSKAINA